jgi:hypothetical protein
MGVLGWEDGAPAIGTYCFSVGQAKYAATPAKIIRATSTVEVEVRLSRMMNLWPQFWHRFSVPMELLRALILMPQLGQCPVSVDMFRLSV